MNEKKAVPLALAVALLASPTLLSAQPGPVKSPVRLELSGAAGALVPATDLIDATGTGPALSMESTFAIGGNLGVLLPGGFGLEAQALFGPGGDFEDEAGEADFFAVTGDVIYRFPVPAVGALIQPFLGAGAGFKELSIEGSTRTGLDGDSSDFVANVLLGTYVTIVPGWRIRLEARDYLSSFSPEGTDGESNLQNDFVLLGGLAFQFP